VEWRELLIVGAALKTGIFKALEKPRTVSELVSELDLDKRATGVVLESLVDLGYLKNSNETFQLLKEVTNPDSLCHELKLIKNWLSLDAVLKIGKPEALPRSNEELGYFIKAMAEMEKKSAGEVVRVCLGEAPNSKSVLDVGGGPGIYAAEFANKGLKTTLFDLPQVVDLVKSDLDGKIDVISGDFNQWLPAGPFDIILLANVCHIYGAEKNIELFKKAKESMSENGYLIVLDFVKGISPKAKIFAVNMLASTASGGTWSKEQYSGWLNKAGLELLKTRNLLSREEQLLIAKKL